MKVLFLTWSVIMMLSMTASAQDDILLPENFYIARGEKVNVHLLSANQFIKQNELGFRASRIQKFMMGNPKKPVDLLSAVKGADSVVPVKFERDGVETLALTTKVVNDDIESDDFIKILEDEGLTTLSEKAKNSNKDTYREKYTWYLKSLVKVGDKASPNDFDRPVGQDFEILLRDNPYKGNYGDDIVAAVNFHDKPIVNTVVLFYIKTADGNVFVQKLTTDKSGQVYLKLTREGIYMLRSLHMEASKEKTADFETWLATCTFAFESTNAMPNTYREFGFGNKH